MASKKYPEKVMSELAQSAFFRPNPPQAEPDSQAELAPLSEDAPAPARFSQEDSKPNSRTTNVRTNERTRERRKIRHTFDIFADQLRALRELALDRESATGDRVLLGELVQEALDMLIEKERMK